MEDFKSLINSISAAHKTMQHQASTAVNPSLTIRNWLIGYYLVEYEQNGKDRAGYGKKLLESLEQEFKGRGIKGLTVRRFRDYRMFLFMLSSDSAVIDYRFGSDVYSAVTDR